MLQFRVNRIATLYLIRHGRLFNLQPRFRPSPGGLTVNQLTFKIRRRHND